MIYSDMVHLPHPISKTHSPMSRANRAAQFAPFAAVVGHEAAVAEAARQTERQHELSEEMLDILDRRFRWLCAHIETHPTVTVTWFCADTRKEGGAYHTVCGQVVRADADGIQIGGVCIPTVSISALDIEGCDE